MTAGNRAIYLDRNPAHAFLHPGVLAAMEPYLMQHWGNPSSLYRPGREAKAAVERARRRIADCLGSDLTKLSSRLAERRRTTWLCGERHRPRAETKAGIL